MKTSLTRIVSIVIVAALLAASRVTQTYAEDGSRPKPLTSQQIDKAVTVNSFGNAGSRKAGVVYHLASCDPAKSPQSPCYLVISESGRFGQETARSVKARGYAIPILAPNSTISCGYDMYNGLGQLAARLQQNVNVTWWGTVGQAPGTFNWGNLNGTRTFLISYSWSGLGGPSTNPGLGTRFNNAGFSTAWGNLVYAPIPGYTQTIYVSTLITINTSGWSCS